MSRERGLVIAQGQHKAASSGRLQLSLLVLDTSILPRVECAGLGFLAPKGPADQAELPYSANSNARPVSRMLAYTHELALVASEEGAMAW
jgi:hypothetical protein